MDYRRQHPKWRGNGNRSKHGDVGSGTADIRPVLPTCAARCGALRIFSVPHNTGPWLRHELLLKRRRRKCAQRFMPWRRARQIRRISGGVKIRSALDQWIGNFPEFYDLCAAGHVDEANAITLKKTSPLMDALQKNAAELARVSRLRREQANIRTLETSKHATGLWSATSRARVCRCSGSHHRFRYDQDTRRIVTESADGLSTNHSRPRHRFLPPASRWHRALPSRRRRSKRPRLQAKRSTRWHARTPRTRRPRLNW